MNKSKITKVAITAALGIIITFAGMLYKLELGSSSSQLMVIGLILQLSAAIMAVYFYLTNRKKETS